MSTSGLPRVIRGDNHTIEVRDGTARARVFKREDTDLSDGARFAGNLADSLIDIAGWPRALAGSLVVDVSQAPAIAGPMTRRSIGRFTERWEQAGRPIIFVVGSEAIKQVQFQGLVTAHAPAWGRVVRTVAEADAALRGHKP